VLAGSRSFSRMSHVCARGGALANAGVRHFSVLALSSHGRLPLAIRPRVGHGGLAGVKCAPHADATPPPKLAPGRGLRAVRGAAFARDARQFRYMLRDIGAQDDLLLPGTAWIHEASRLRISATSEGRRLARATDPLRGEVAPRRGDRPPSASRSRASCSPPALVYPPAPRVASTPRRRAARGATLRANQAARSRILTELLDAVKADVPSIGRRFASSARRRHPPQSVRSSAERITIASAQRPQALGDPRRTLTSRRKSSDALAQRALASTTTRVQPPRRHGP